MYNQILKSTLSDLSEKKVVLAKALLIPLIILVCIELYIKTIQDPQLVWGKMFFISIFSLFVSVYVAITTHRILLLGSNSVPVWGSLKFTSREGSFILKTFLLACLITIPVVLFSLIGNIFIIAGVFISMILFSRLSLVFPAVAVDEELSFSQSWELTKNYKFLTFITVVFFPALLTLLVGFVYSLAINFLVKVVSPHLALLSVLLDLFITVLIVGCLSSTYRFIRDEEKEFFQKSEDNEPARKIETKRDEDTIKTFIDIKHNVTFKSLQKDLTAQYEPLGFIKTVIDKSDSWMIKNPKQGAAYVLLSLKGDDFVIETYNTDEPEIEIFE